MLQHHICYLHPRKSTLHNRHHIRPEFAVYIVRHRKTDTYSVKPACGKSLNIGAHIGRMPFHLRQSILHESVNTVRIGGSIYGLDTRMYAPVYRLLAYTHDKKHIGLNDTFGYNNFIYSELKGGNIFIISAGYAELLKL